MFLFLKAWILQGGVSNKGNEDDMSSQGASTVGPVHDVSLEKLDYNML